nr:set domain-containing protein 5 [Quercus suber]
MISLAQGTRSRSSSPNGSTKSRGSAFNPQAPVFIPCVSPSTDAALSSIPPEFYIMRESRGKGKGLFATKFIPRGTLIIREMPLILAADGAPQIVEAYVKLPEAQKIIYDDLHSYLPRKLDLESATDPYSVDWIDTTESMPISATQARVMGIFAANSFATSGDDRLALFVTIARLNHSCVPNVYHCYNAYENCMTIHASQDITEGTELFTDYIQEASSYQTRAHRIEQLRCRYGFTCQCSACSDRSGTSDMRRTALNDLMCGLHMYIFQGFEQPCNSDSYSPSTPEMALDQAQYALGLFSAEGISNLEVLKAYRLVSMGFFQLREFEEAMHYALCEEDLAQDLLGSAADLFGVFNHGPAGVWARKIARVASSGMNQNNDAQSSLMDDYENYTGGYKHSPDHDQISESQTYAPASTNSEPDDAELMKMIKYQKRRIQKNNSKAEKREEAEVRAQKPAT